MNEDLKTKVYCPPGTGFKIEHHESSNTTFLIMCDVSAQTDLTMTIG